MKLYEIEFFIEGKLQRWMSPGPNFTCLKRGEAYGAWGTIKSFYGDGKKWRLKQGNNIIEEWDSGHIKTNNINQSISSEEFMDACQDEVAGYLFDESFSEDYTAPISLSVKEMRCLYNLLRHVEGKSPLPVV